MNEKRYRAVLFDLGGTLRIALEDEPYMRHARRKLAELAGTIPYELTCAVSKRVPRLYMENGKEIERSLRLL